MRRDLLVGGNSWRSFGMRAPERRANAYHDCRSSGDWIVKMETAKADDGYSKFLCADLSDAH